MYTTTKSYNAVTASNKLTLHPIHWRKRKTQEWNHVIRSSTMSPLILRTECRILSDTQTRMYYCLLRNFSVDKRLVKNARLLITNLGHLKQCQFPLTAAYATTFNSCQWLTLDHIGIDLTRPVFSHGQLYTALNDIAIRSMTNGMSDITYEKILQYV